jgi:hypothetical protein
MSRWLAVMSIVTGCLGPVVDPADGSGLRSSAVTVGSDGGAGGGVASACATGAARRIFASTERIESMTLQSSGTRALRSVGPPPFLPLKREIDLDGHLLSTTVEPTHDGAGLGAITTDGRGLTAFFSSENSTSEQRLTYLGPSGAQTFTDLPPTPWWTSQRLAWDEAHAQLGLFWASPNGGLRLQIRSLDGGVNVATGNIINDTFAGKHALASGHAG